MRLYIVRHAESIGTIGENLQHPDEPLTEFGHKEAELLVDRLSGTPVEQVIAGPMLRTQQTAEKIAKRFNIPVDVVEHFRGMKRPTEQMSYTKNHPRVREIDALIKYKFHDPTWRYGDGETFEDIKSRVLQGLKLIEQSKHKHVALVTHSVIMRYLLGCMIFGRQLTSHEMESVLMSFRVPTPGFIVTEFQGTPTSTDVWSARSKTGWVVEAGFDLRP